MQTAFLYHVKPLNNGICIPYEYILRLPLSVTPIRIQFIAKSSSIYRKIYWCHKYQAFWRSGRKDSSTTSITILSKFVYVCSKGSGSLSICTDLPEPMLLTYALSTNILCTGPLLILNGNTSWSVTWLWTYEPLMWKPEKACRTSECLNDDDHEPGHLQSKQPSFFAQRYCKSLATHRVHSKDSDQNKWIYTVTWVI